MNFRNICMLASLALAAGAAQAAGPLYLTDDKPPRPLAWYTGGGPIPVYTDGGGAFTYNTNGTVFLSIERADQITAFAFKQWTDVPTATFAAELAGKYKDVLVGIEDITGANAEEVYQNENGYGFWVNYDTDGSILEQYFGVSKTAVLGIAFPEWTDDKGYITEATAVLNGYAVHVSDTQGNNIAGVFTHEFGHAVNLSHSQVNGPMYYSSNITSTQYYPGVPGCVNPVHRWNHPTGTGVNKAPLDVIETMYPFISSTAAPGQAHSTVDRPDDIAAISNLYPTADYLANTGSIAGVLRLKDGKTPYSGINVIARNVASPLHDAVSAMTGDQTQGEIGPDGRFRINNLKPGQDYVVYIESITAGGYPTSPMPLVSQAEYWDAAEGTSPATDLPCNATPIRAVAGVTKQADIYFNGYKQGMDFMPVAAAQLMDLSKDGKRAAGLVNTTSFTWDKLKGFLVLPEAYKANNASMNRNGQWMTVNYDFDGDGITQAALWSTSGMISLGDLNGETCATGGIAHKYSSYGWAMDDDARTAVGTGYVDKDGDGICATQVKGEVVPFVWNAKGGIKQLDVSALPGSATTFVRAHAINGNGRVILGGIGASRAAAWVDQGPGIDLSAKFGARDAYATSYDGSKVAFQRYTSSRPNDVIIWNPFAPAGSEPRSLGSLRWCVDLPYIAQGKNQCTSMTADAVYQVVGAIPTIIADMSDDGSVIIGRAGNAASGLIGLIWIDGVGWIKWTDFVKKQGVAEAYAIPFNNPIAISASGSELVGGILGSNYSWYSNIDQVFVCENGVSVQTGFPNGLRDKIAAGAKFGRCEHL